MRKVVSAPGLDIPGVSREAGKMGAQREREKKVFLEAALLGMYPPHTKLKEAMAGVQSFETNRLNHTIRQFFNEASIFAGSITCLAKDHLQLRMLLQEQRDHRQLGILMTHNEKLELLLRHRIAQTEKSGADRGFSAAPDVAGVPDANGLPGEDTGPDPQKQRALLEALQQTLPEEMLRINDSPPQAFSVVFQTLKDNRKMKNNLEEERQRLNAELVELNQQKGMLEELSQRDDLKLFLAPLLLEYPQKRQKSQQKVEGQLKALQARMANTAMNERKLLLSCLIALLNKPDHTQTAADDSISSALSVPRKRKPDSGANGDKGADPAKR